MSRAFAFIFLMVGEAHPLNQSGLSPEASHKQYECNAYADALGSISNSNAPLYRVASQIIQHWRTHNLPKIEL